MIIYIHDACPSTLIGRRAEIRDVDHDEHGTFAIVRMLDGDPVDYGDPDGFTVVCTAWGPRPPARPPTPSPGPDNRVCRWIHRRNPVAYP